MDASALTDRSVCERARLARDARFDGLFFTAVRSTGIYCRPVCPAPAPRPDNVRYYPSAAAASAAGYRPCLRCRPELSPPAWQRHDEAALRQALALIGEGVLQDGGMAGLAAGVGVGARQLQRIFVHRLGATPVQVHATRRLLLAKQLLTETALPVTQVALAAGFNSLRRFNAAFLAGCGMPPTALRRQRPATPGHREGLVLRLAYRPPLDFPALLAFLRRRAIPGIERVGSDRYERVVAIGDRALTLCVQAVPRRDELRLHIGGVPDPRAIPALVRGVRRLFDLDADPAAVNATLAADPLLAPSVRARPGLRVPGAWDGFEIAVRAVLGQQVSVAAATTLAARLVERHGRPLAAAAPGLDRAFPTQDSLRQAPLEALGLPRSRAATLRALAAACADGRLDLRGGQPLERLVAACSALPGIGEWTAHYIALRLGEPDAFPAADLVLRRALGAGGPLTAATAQARSQAWRPWRAYAVLHLWHGVPDSLPRNLA